MKSFGKFLSLFIVFVFVFPPGFVKAQSEATNGPVYVIQEGDSLWDIAYRFHVSQQELASINGIVNANEIAVGQRLVIPDLEGIEGELSAENVQFGETIHSLSLRYHIPVSLLKRLNHLTSPNEIYAGYFLVILRGENSNSTSKRSLLYSGESLLELSVLNDTNPWSVLANNQLDNSSQVLPGDVIRVPGADDSGPGGLPPDITSISLSKLVQGETAEVQIAGDDGLSLAGMLMSHPLNFFAEPGVGYAALQGIHAMAEPGLYPMSLSETFPDSTRFEYAQNVLVTAGDFLYDLPLSVDPATMDPETTVPEDKQWMSVASGVSPEKLWEGAFTIPVEPVFADCYASRFGSRRSYNGSEYIYFHTGLDYCGQIGDPIYATAAGVVVFTGLLTVRGNATMIDHGQGVFSAYMHQSEILVNVGDHVEQGQLIGRVGNTGRVEGPHLHFEILVGGVQVNPIDWLNQIYP